MCFGWEVRAIIHHLSHSHSPVLVALGVGVVKTRGPAYFQWDNECSTTIAHSFHLPVLLSNSHPLLWKMITEAIEFECNGKLAICMQSKVRNLIYDSVYYSTWCCWSPPASPHWCITCSIAAMKLSGGWDKVNRIETEMKESQHYYMTDNRITGKCIFVTIEDGGGVADIVRSRFKATLYISPI